jgi:hypothetical protein
MNRAEERKLLIEEIRSLKDERIIDAIMELLAFGRKYSDDSSVDESSLVNEEGEKYLQKGDSKLAKSLKEWKE